MCPTHSKPRDEVRRIPRMLTTHIERAPQIEYNRRPWAQTTIGACCALGPFTATALVAGTVIGSGIFVKPKSIAENVPGFDMVAVVWILGGLLALLGALSLAEVAVLFPRAGGNYVFLREGYGRLAGFLWGWVDFWIIRAASIAALATIFSDSLHDVIREVRQLGATVEVLSFWQRQYLTIGVISALALINMRGVRWGGGLQLLITVVKVASLLAILALPFVLWGEINPAATQPRSGPSFRGAIWARHFWGCFGLIMAG